MTQQQVINPQVTSKILAFAYLCIGGINTIIISSVSVALIMTERDPLLHLRPQKQVVAIILSLVLVFSTIQLVIGFGLLKRRAWARIAALVSSLFFALYFPIGSLLCLFTWWFLRTEDGKALYRNS